MHIRPSDVPSAVVLCIVDTILANRVAALVIFLMKP